jgi:hypothetical protein
MSASSGAAVVNGALYLAPVCRGVTRVVVPLGYRPARRRLSRHNSRFTVVAGMMIDIETASSLRSSQ